MTAERSAWGAPKPLVSDAATGASTMHSTTKRGNASRRRSQHPYSPNRRSGALTASIIPAKPVLCRGLGSPWMNRKSGLKYET